MAKVNNQELFNSPLTDVPPNKKELRKTIAALRNKKVLIVGDVMLDAYLLGNVERISPEAPVPIVQVSEERFLLGGSGNVARNITALGGKAVLVGVRGDDQAGENLVGLLKENGVEEALLITRDRPTTIKTRVLAQGQQVLRVDREKVSILQAEAQRGILEAVAERAGGCGAVIVSDYGKGLISLPFMQSLRKLIDVKRVPILVDPKPQNLNCYEGVTLMTPNAKETAELTHMPAKTLPEVVGAGRAIMKRLGTPHMLTTLGADGMAVFEREDRIWHIPTVARRVFDVTGAGDTVIATLGLSLAAGEGLLGSSILANLAAGRVVGEIGAATVSAAQLAESLEDFDPEIKRLS